LGKILKFDRGVQETPLGLTHHNNNYASAVKLFEMFQCYRYIKQKNTNPTLVNRPDLFVKEEHKKKFYHLAWEYEYLDLIYSQNTRPYSNEELNYMIPKLKRIYKDIGDIEKFMKDKLDDVNNSKPKKILGNLLPPAINESRKELLSTKRLLFILEREAEGDLKKQKKNRPREALSLIYAVQVLKEIYNCLDIKKAWRDFIHQEIVRIPSLSQLQYITIETAIKKSKGKAFQDQWLRSARDEDELENIRKFILG
jgi:hypothetical protein